MAGARHTAWQPWLLLGIIPVVAGEEDYLTLDDRALLSQCDVNYTKSSGPGGQHRNKVSSAVRLRHHPTGITAQGQESRSQHENKLRALQRLRMNIACRMRRPVDVSGENTVPVPPVVSECIYTARGGQAAGLNRIRIGRKDRRFWQVAAFLLDVLDASTGKLADAARGIGVTTSSFVSVLKADRHLLAAAQAIRKNHGLKPLS